LFQSKTSQAVTRLLAGTLALLVATILADNPHHAIATHDFAVTANTFY
jgi:hypothetical protein